MTNTNPILPIDGYKLDHRRQYPEGITRVYSNFTPRMSRIDGQTEVVFLGLQMFLAKNLMEDFEAFFNGDIDEICAEYERRVNGYLGPNEVGTDHIRALHALGYLPLEFRALPEGTLTPLRVPMLTVENTHDDFAWLVNYFETVLSNSIWMSCTSATTAYRFRKLIQGYAEKTGSDPFLVNFQGHDFSMRGMAGVEASCLSGIGHLAAFIGTDTIPAIETIEKYYAPTHPDFLIGASVPATEHSVMCAGGKESEIDTYRRLLDLYPTGIVSIVSDTWDYWKVLTETLPKLHESIMQRDGKLVVRPDSGDPVKVLVGDPDAPIGSPQYKGTIEVLWDEFGGTITETGYKLLDSHIGVIYGDSITEARATQILAGLEAKGFATGSVVFGMGSYLYQYTTRDTYGFAMKATSIVIDGVQQAIFKDPVTDSGFKRSAVGRLAVVENERGRLTLIDNATPEQEAESLLRPVWRDGNFIQTWGFDEVRGRVLEAI